MFAMIGRQQKGMTMDTKTYDIEGAEVKSRLIGHTVAYEVTGDWTSVAAAIRSIHGTYPTPGYGTWFNWPPNGPNKTYGVPKRLEDGRWKAFGDRSTSCD